MILTHCPVCAAQLHSTNAKQCSRCKTRYCGAACQEQHWKEGGHDKLCKKIKRAGGAEQYHADTKYSEAVTVAVEKCADDTKGQTCYICTQALHWKTKEGLVRGCSCRGTAGFAHVSCLAEQAKILVAEAEENNLGAKVLDRWSLWSTCSLCEQKYHGVVHCALGWACWKTYLGRPETGRVLAMKMLGNGLSDAGRHEDALPVREAELAMYRRAEGPEASSWGISWSILTTQGNIAMSLTALGRFEEAVRMRQEVYSGLLKLNGEEDESTLKAAMNHAASLVSLKRFEEFKSLMRKMIPVARRALGESNDTTLRMRSSYANALCEDTDATLDDLREAVTTLEDTARIARRVFGGAHPLAAAVEGGLRQAQEALRARKGDDVSALRDLMAAMPPPGSA